MTYGAFSSEEFASFDRGGRPREPLTRIALGVIALLSTASSGLWIAHTLPRPAPPSVDVLSGAGAVSNPRVLRAAKAQPSPYGALVLPTRASTDTPVVFARIAPLRRVGPDHLAATSTTHVAEPGTADAHSAAGTQLEPPIVPPVPAVPALARDIPLPAPRPADLTAGVRSPRSTEGRVAQSAPVAPPPAVPPSAAPPAAEPSQPSFFDKLFGGLRPGGSALAYASPEDGGLGSILKGALGRPVPHDRYTAVYDIAAHTVTLPDGSRLEAHSGTGAWVDDPRGVAARMRGATPPNVYDLKPREALFHGVRALRMTPIGDGETYGRAGLLTHSYMLRGRDGESNGCVVFKDYDAFLRAYDSGQIRRLAVVARLN